MSNNTTPTPLQIVERKSFNKEGKLQVMYYIWLGNECVNSTELLCEAEEIYDNIIKSNQEPTRTIIKSTYINN